MNVKKKLPFVILMIILTSCTSRKYLSVPEGVFERWNVGYSTIKGKGMMYFKNEEFSDSFRFEMMYQKKDKLRVDVFYPFLGNVARLIRIENNSALYDFTKNIVYLPESSGCEITNTMIGNRIPEDIMISALLYEYAIDTGGKDSIVTNNFARTVIIHPIKDKEINVEIFEKDYIIHVKYSEVIQDFLPAEIVVHSLEEGEIKVKYTELVLDEAFSDDLFVITNDKLFDTLYIGGI